MPAEPVSPLSNAQYDNTRFEEYAKSLRQNYKLNKKILLVQVPQYQFQYFNKDIVRSRCFYVFPPTGLQCLAKALEKRDFKVDILDLNYQLLKRVIEDDAFDYHNWLSILDEYLDKHKPSIIGTTCINVNKLFTETNPFTDFLRHLKKRNEHIVITGGATAMNEHEELLKSGLCHFIFDGEGENKLNFLLDVLFDEKRVSLPTPEIYFPFKEQLEKTNGPKDIVELSGNIISTYKLVPVEEYHRAGLLNHYSRMAGPEKPFATLQLNRGCRANCMFCGVTKFMGQRTRHYPPRDLLEEINFLVEKKGVRHFEWLDDDLLADEAAIKEVLKGMIPYRQKYGITWAANNGLIAAFLTEELLGLMRDTGCVGFKIGVEAGTPEMLRRIRKPGTIEKIKRACEMINKFPELFVAGSFIIGFFGEETFGQMLATLKFSCETNLDWSSISVFQFTSKPTISKEKLKPKDLGDTAVIPARERGDGKINISGEIVSGPEIFNLPKDLVPSADQVRQIWLAFNLVGNYINNKNLMPGGSPEKFVRWTEILEDTYPYNCYMPLFASLGHVMLGNKHGAEKQLEKAKNNLQHDDYWRRIFEQFELTSILDNFPKNAGEVQDILAPLRKKYSKWTGIN